MKGQKEETVWRCGFSYPSHAETLVNASGPVGSLLENHTVQSNENRLN